MGMTSLADDGIKALNRAAEDAVKEATPIFVSAIKNITITDAKSILMGNDNSATSYLQTTTTKAHCTANLAPSYKHRLEK